MRKEVEKCRHDIEINIQRAKNFSKLVAVHFAYDQEDVGHLAQIIVAILKSFSSSITKMSYISVKRTTTTKF